MPTVRLRKRTSDSAIKRRVFSFGFRFERQRSPFQRVQQITEIELGNFTNALWEFRR